MKKLLFLFLCAGFLLPAGRLHAQTFKVIVNSANPVSSITKAEASKLFLKKRSKWNHGAEVQPVELPGSSSVRGSFTKEIHNKKPAAISAYWQKQIFAGRATPPPEKGSDAEVVAYVQANPGAIGYVSSGASVSGVKVVEITP